ncbi:hypothetical protein LCGC14_1741040 [marine sediment metagenome]|uniref:PABS domain-containing protein n=1 Tax=marine sediment metagenome TaxID=412755 RepID=A0A0F9JLV2_9ZZZZ
MEYKVDVPEGVSGDWEILKFTVKEHDIRAISYALQGRPVPPGIYTRLTKKGAFVPMMSDTPAEVRDHLYFIHKATGRCLINGLGLGVVLKAILAKPEVTHVDVVETEQDIINLVWPTYKNSNRVVLHHADAFTIEWPKGTWWDCAWHDIWPSICTDNLPEIAKLKRKYGRKVTYQAAWVEDELRYNRRHGY